MVNKIENKIYNHDLIQIDGKRFIECTFNNCTFEYTGIENPGFENCTLNDCSWRFADAAEKTINFMRAIYHGFGDYGIDLIERTFENIRKGQPLKHLIH